MPCPLPNALHCRARGSLTRSSGLTKSVLASSLIQDVCLPSTLILKSLHNICLPNSDRYGPRLDHCPLDHASDRLQPSVKLLPGAVTTCTPEQVWLCLLVPALIENRAFCQEQLAHTEPPPTHTHSAAPWVQAWMPRVGVVDVKPVWSEGGHNWSG